jgi:hypothetical protein
MSQEKDSITSFYRQRFIDYSLDPINIQFRWTVFGIVIVGIIGFFFKGLIAASLAGGLIFVAWIFRRLRIQVAKFEIAMEEIRYRFEDTNKKIVDVHTSIGYIYGEKLGLTSEEGFDPLLLLWERKRAITEDLSSPVSEIRYKKLDDGSYRIVWLAENGTRGDESVSADKLVDEVGVNVAEKIINGEGQDSSGTGVIRLPVA